MPETGERDNGEDLLLVVPGCWGAPNAISAPMVEEVTICLIRLLEDYKLPAFLAPRWRLIGILTFGQHLGKSEIGVKTVPFQGEIKWCIFAYLLCACLGEYPLEVLVHPFEARSVFSVILGTHKFWVPSMPRGYDKEASLLIFSHKGWGARWANKFHQGETGDLVLLLQWVGTRSGCLHTHSDLWETTS